MSHPLKCIAYRHELKRVVVNGDRDHGGIVRGACQRAKVV